MKKILLVMTMLCATASLSAFSFGRVPHYKAYADSFAKKAAMRKEKAAEFDKILDILEKHNSLPNGKRYNPYNDGKLTIFAANERALIPRYKAQALGAGPVGQPVHVRGGIQIIKRRSAPWRKVTQATPLGQQSLNKK